MHLKRDRVISALLLASALLAGSQASRAATVSWYGIGKLQNYVQTGDTAVAPASDSGFVFQAFAVPTSADSLFSAFVWPPGGSFNIVSMDQFSDYWFGEQSYSSQSELDQAFPVGTYTNWFNTDTPPLTLAAGTYPTRPQITNFAATQSVDPTTDLTLTWTPFAGATGDDFVLVTVTDDSGNVVAQTGYPGQATALATSAQSYKITSSQLQSLPLTVSVSFNHVTSRNTTSLAGAVGVTTYSSATAVTLKASGSSTGGGGGGGGGDTVPPSLLSSQPATGAQNVAVTAAVVLSFSEAMAPKESIFWTGQGIVSNQFNYVWSADQKTLTCTYTGGFPNGIMVSWVLDPSGFQDVAGNELAQTANIFGYFMTASSGSSGGSGNTNQCGNTVTNEVDAGSITIFKLLNYVQTNSAPPTLDTDTPAVFEAAVISPTNNPVSQATVTLPNGTTRILTNFFGRNFFLLEQFADQQSLEAAYPSGTYTAVLQRANGTTTTTITLPANSYPPTPQLTDYSVVTGFNAAANQTVQWMPFTGAVPRDAISFDLSDGLGHNFHAPDPCVPIALTNTDVSIVVPKNTLATGSPVSGSLTFEKFLILDTNSVPGIAILAAVGKTTNFDANKPNTGGGNAPTVGSVTRDANGTVHLQVSGDAGATVVVEASDDLKTWTMIDTRVVSQGTFEVVDPLAAGQNARFYRAWTQ